MICVLCVINFTTTSSIFPKIKLNRRSQTDEDDEGISCWFIERKRKRRNDSGVGAVDPSLKAGAVENSLKLLGQ